MKTWAHHLTRFYKDLPAPAKLPPGVELLHPHLQPGVMELAAAFFEKYYGDNNSRKIIMGINPGRFGAGITGINFTAPRQLHNNCGIAHALGDSSELSAEFIYEMIDACGGPVKFYRNYFISAVSPLGFTQAGKNLNYYDSRKLEKAVTPFINSCLERQFSFGFDTDACYCIGEDKNFKFLNRLNETRRQQGLVSFDTIISLPHPRFIMQYRRKEKQRYIDLYVKILCCL